ncbi:adenosine deaminase [Colwellia sp. MB02u-6]|uniref:adenosine deaminase n=1 Tax=Colwellia sp. MB02u-6 TaxID=2759824 RepID=UPI0015F3BD07|nr:adenosine deaminase [Colwellia sp. MB02u-6]MBA6327389.1 adenosine deaminase [Colwellia sp. MB02u-6]
MKLKVIFTLAIATIFASGCSTILTDDTHKMNVSTSNGKKIDVEVDGNIQAVPGIVIVEKENKDKILITKDAACTSNTALNKEVETTFFVNLLSGGVLGSSTDYGTAKMWKYQDSVTISCN